MASMHPNNYRPWAAAAAALAALSACAVTIHTTAPWALLAGAVLFGQTVGGGETLARTRRRILGLVRRRMPRPDAAALLAVAADTGDEIWIDKDSACAPLLVSGHSGPGRVEAMLGMAASALATGSGAVIVDGVGDVATFARLYAMARAIGREDDLLVLNFAVGGKSRDGFQSHTLDMFASGDADTLCALMTELLDPTGSDGAMWMGRGKFMLTAVLRALVHLRDVEGVPLDAARVRDHLGLRKVIELSESPRVDDASKLLLRNYLHSLPGFVPQAGFRQSNTTLDQHGYLEMLFAVILGSLADVYGHILTALPGDVDMRDVAANRRILYVSLPCGTSRGGSEAVARLVAESLRLALVGMLDTGVDGDYDKAIAPPAAKAPPIAVLLDDASYFLPGGIERMAAQPDLLGLRMIFGSSDKTVSAPDGRLAAAIRTAKRIVVGDGGRGRIGGDDSPVRLEAGAWPKPAATRANRFIRFPSRSAVPTQSRG
jgi:hypothetical protein